MLSEEEILIRAREAVIKANEARTANQIAAIREGRAGDNLVAAAAQALRDLDKPLSEIQPVDPDLIEARQFAANAGRVLGYSEVPFLRGDKDESSVVQDLLAAIKRGRELERDQC